MLVGTARDNKGRQFILLGLTEENIAALKAGRPIHLQPETHSLPDDVTIGMFYGKDADDLRQMVREVWSDAVDMGDGNGNR